MRTDRRLLPALLGIAICVAFCGSCLAYLHLRFTLSLYLRSPYAEEWLANNTNRYPTRGNRMCRAKQCVLSFTRKGGRGKGNEKSPPPIMTGQRRKWAGKYARKLQLRIRDVLLHPDSPRAVLADVPRRAFNYPDISVSLRGHRKNHCFVFLECDTLIANFINLADKRAL